MIQHLRKRWYLYIFGILCAGAFLVWLAAFQLEAKSNILTIAFLDVGQGDAIFLETPRGKQLLIDAGPNKKVLSELGKVMPFWDRSIDTVVATHPDSDHIGGMPDVLERYSVDYIFDSAVRSDSSLYDTWQEAIRKENATYAHLYRGTRIILDENIRFDILYPEQGKITGKEPNEASLIMKLVYGNVCMIFTGDIERNGEWEVRNDDIDCDVLKVAHHGSKTSTSDAFLQAVSPVIAVISSGKDNRYGHPHEVILGKLQTAGISVLRTDTEGMITLFSDGEKIWVKK